MVVSLVDSSLTPSLRLPTPLTLCLSLLCVLYKFVLFVDNFAKWFLVTVLEHTRKVLVFLSEWYFLCYFMLLFQVCVTTRFKARIFREILELFNMRLISGKAIFQLVHHFHNALFRFFLIEYSYYFIIYMVLYFIICFQCFLFSKKHISTQCVTVYDLKWSMVINYWYSFGTRQREEEMRGRLCVTLFFLTMCAYVFV